MVDRERRSILLVTNDLGPRAGGIETFILGLLSQLDGSRILIYTSKQEGDREFDKNLRQQYGVEIIRDRTKILLPTPRVFAALAQLCDRYGVETIWYGAAAPLAWLAPFFNRRGTYRQVALTHGHEVWWAKLWPFSWALSRMGNALDVITYLGNFTRDAIRPAFGDKPEYVRIAPGISIEHFTLPSTGSKSHELVNKYGLSDKKVIISVGRLVHRKGQDRLIQALPEILQSEPNAVLVLVGVGPYEKKLRALAAELKVESHIKFLGRLQYTDLPAHIALGDVFAMPSRSRFFGLEVEGLGIVYLEASACGLPVIAGKSGGAPDAIQEGVTGFAVDGNDLHALAEKIVYLLHSPEEARAMGLAGRTWVEAQWSWQLWGKKFNELLTPTRK